MPDWYKTHSAPADPGPGDGDVPGEWGAVSDLNPDGPHGRDHTAEVGNLLFQCSRFITGMEAPNAT